MDSFRAYKIFSAMKKSTPSQNLLRDYIVGSIAEPPIQIQPQTTKDWSVRIHAGGGRFARAQEFPKSLQLGSDKRMKRLKGVTDYCGKTTIREVELL